MSVNLVDIIELKYPGQINAGNVSFRQEWSDSPIKIIKWEVPGILQPSEDDLLAESSSWELPKKLKALQDIAEIEITKILDSKAQERKYKDAYSLISYAQSSNTQWASEAASFIMWRDKVYAYAINELDLVSKGGETPTIDKFLSGIPVLIWPN